MEQFNNLIEFRQAIYEHGLTRARDAQFELLDALLLGQPIRSFPELSLLPVFRRKWSSIYAAIKEGQQDWEWLAGYFIQHIPAKGPLLFSLDGTAWPHPAAKTLDDLQYVYSPTPAVDGGSIVVGHPYSVLAWVPNCCHSQVPRPVQSTVDQLWSVIRTLYWPGYLRVAAVGHRQFLSDERPASSPTLRLA